MACFSKWDIQNCGCAAPCTYTHHVTGCGSLDLAGAVVSVWNNSGKTVSYGGGTTDSSGNVGGISIPAAGTYYREITCTRFTMKSGTFSVSSCGSTFTDSMSANADTSTYFCQNCCAYPLKKTLVFSSGKFGTWTGDWVAGASGFTSTPACTPCSGGYTIYPGFFSSVFPCTVIVAIFQNISTGCPQTFGLPGGGTCANIGYVASVSMTCPVTGTFAWSGDTSIASATGCLDKATGCGTYPWTDTITVTE